VKFQYTTAITSISTPGTSRATRQPMVSLTPAMIAAPINTGIRACATPPPLLPQPAAAALAVPTTREPNITEVWYWVITKLAPTAPIPRRNSRKLS
jgi:hypothetical protein